MWFAAAINAQDGTDGGGRRVLALSVRGDNGGEKKGMMVLTALLGAFDLTCAAGVLQDCSNCRTRSLPEAR